MPIKVRVIKSSKETFWYATKVGRTFDVLEFDDEFFVVDNDENTDLIKVKDAKIIRSRKWFCPKCRKSGHNPNELITHMKKCYGKS